MTPAEEQQSVWVCCPFGGAKQHYVFGEETPRNPDQDKNVCKTNKFFGRLSDFQAHTGENKFSMVSKFELLSKLHLCALWNNCQLP